MKLSVIIPYYNSDAWIGPLLDSLLDQDLPPEDYEFIVVDDGSAEEPVQLRRYVVAYPTRIHYFRQENGGVSAARNTGIGLAKGDWLYFCDSDDLVQPQILGRLLAIAEAHRLDMFFGRVIEINPGDPVPAPRRNFDNLSPVWNGLEYIAAHPVMRGYGVYQFLLRHAFLEKHQLRFRPVLYPEDRYFLLDALFKAERIMEVDVDLYYYVQQQSSIMHAQMRNFFEKKFSDPVRTYLVWLSERMDDPALPEDARQSLFCWRDINSYHVLLASFRYASPRILNGSLDLLSRLGAYPLLIRGEGKEAFLRRWMNRRPLWLLGARLYHLIPSFIRKKY